MLELMRIHIMELYVYAWKGRFILNINVQYNPIRLLGEKGNVAVEEFQLYTILNTNKFLKT